MSQSAVTEILRRAKTDAKFRAMLLADPAKVLSKYDLTRVEIKMIRALDEDDLLDDGKNSGTQSLHGGFIPGGGG